MSPSLQTLFLPLESDDVPRDRKTLFLGAQWHPFLASFPEKPHCAQFLAPQAKELESRGFDILPTRPVSGTYGLVILHLPKQVDEAKYWIALALEFLAKDGILLAAAANDAGGGRIQDWLKETGMKCDSLSKNKSRAVWGVRPEKLSDIVSGWEEQGRKQWVELKDELHFLTQPGIFGWNKIDTGSALLAEHLPDGLSGVGADFGCGYGYLSCVLLENTPPKELHLIDYDSRATACAEENIKDVQGACQCMFHWADLSKPVKELPPLNFIVMNPPFHTGKKTDAGLGQDFIRTSAHHLRKGGWLIMVANAHLPYETILNELFFKVETLAAKDGFKVLKATK